MSNDINLVARKDTDIIKAKKRIKVVRIIAITSLCVVSFLAIVIFIISSQMSLANLKKDKSYALSNISFLHNKSAKLAVVSNRVIDINNILTKRKSYAVTIDAILNVLPTDLSVNVFELDKDAVFVTVYGNSLKSMDKFLNGLLDINNKKKLISGITVQSLSVSQKVGSYSLSVKMKLL